jgi:hypothetical protein
MVGSQKAGLALMVGAGLSAPEVVAQRRIKLRVTTTPLSKKNDEHEDVESKATCAM